MSFVLFAAVAALTAGAAGALFGRRAGALPKPEVPSPAEGPVPDSAFVGLPLSVGDVVSISVDAPGTSRAALHSRERWLTGAIFAREGNEVVAVIFFAPEGSTVECVAAFPSPRSDIAWLSSTTTEIGAEPPSTLEIDGKILERKSRIPVAIERVGRNVPRLGEGATLAEYVSGRDVALVVRGDAGSLSLVGVRLEAGEFERMGQGGLS